MKSFFNVLDWVIFVEDNLHLGTPENTWAVNQAPPPSGDKSAPLDAGTSSPDGTSLLASTISLRVEDPSTADVPSV